MPQRQKAFKLRDKCMGGSGFVFDESSPPVFSELDRLCFELASRILRQHCSSEFVDVFDRLTPGQQFTARQCLRESLHQLFVHIRLGEGSTDAEEARDKPGRRSRKHSINDRAIRSHAQLQPGQQAAKDCLVKTFLETALKKTVAVTQHHVDVIESRLATWGRFRLGSDECYLFHRLTMSDRLRMKHEGGFEALPLTPAASQEKRVCPWEALKIACAEDLNLFAVKTGTALVGTLMAAPVVMNDTIHLIVEDAHGRAVPVYIHNCMPESKAKGESGVEARIKRKFPMLARIAIAEPHCMIDTDGCRVVWVRSRDAVRIGPDADAFLQFLNASQLPREIPPALPLPQLMPALEKLAAAGKAQELIDQALASLHGGPAAIALGDHVKLLANRSQAALNCGDAAAALRDAAAVLVLCPTHEKGWHRYKAALRALLPDHEYDAASMAARADCVAGALSSHGTQQTSRAPDTASASAKAHKAAYKVPSIDAIDIVLRAVLTHDAAEGSPVALDHLHTASALQEHGNELFRAGDSSAARVAYTAALLRHPLGKDAANLLYMLADACLHADSLHSALAVSAASIAIGIVHCEPVHSMTVARALQCLGRPGLALAYLRVSGIKLLRGGLAGNDEVWNLCTAGVKLLIEASARCEQERGKAGLDTGIAFQAPYDYLGPVELVLTANTLAFAAKTALPPHTVLVISRPIAFGLGGPKGTTKINVFGRRIDVHSSQKRLRDELASVAAEDPLKARSVDHLAQTQATTDERGRTNRYTYRHGTETLLAEVQQALSPRVLPLLPQWPRYFPADEHPPLLTTAHSRVSLLHGSRWSSPGAALASHRTDPGSSIYPLASLLRPGDVIDKSNPTETGSYGNCVWALGATCNFGTKAPEQQTVVVLTRVPVEKGTVLTAVGGGPPRQSNGKWFSSEFQV